jgi:hypothetical protein
MEKMLQKIANLLIINVQNINGLGLLNGKMGIAVFLYHYARYTSQTVYSDQADDLLDELFAALNVIMQPSLADGVAGIGLGLNYLIDNRFIETDENPDELFKGIDRRLIQDFNMLFVADTKTNLPVFSAGFYALLRIKTGNRTTQKNQFISSLLDGIQAFYADKKWAPNLVFTNSVIHFLIGVHNVGMYRKKPEKTLKTVLSLALDTFPDTKYSFPDIDILRNLLSSVKFYPVQVNELRLRINQLNLSPANNEDTNSIVSDLQQYMFYPDANYSCPSQFSIEKYLDEQIADSSFQNLLPLAYLGLHIMGVKLC